MKEALLYETPLITEEQLNYLHKITINTFGGSHGVRDEGGLDAALKSPHITFGGKELFETDLQKCCKLFCSIIQHHPYIDGNKRAGVDAFLFSLALNGFNYKKLNKQELYDVAMKVASGIYNYEDVYEIIRKIYNKD